MQEYYNEDFNLDFLNGNFDSESNLNRQTSETFWFPMESSLCDDYVINVNMDEEEIKENGNLNKSDVN